LSRIKNLKKNPQTSAEISDFQGPDEMRHKLVDIICLHLSDSDQNESSIPIEHILKKQ